MKRDKKLSNLSASRASFLDPNPAGIPPPDPCYVYKLALPELAVVPSPWQILDPPLSGKGFAFAEERDLHCSGRVVDRPAPMILEM